MILPFVTTLFNGTSQKATVKPFETISVSPFYLNKDTTIVVKTRSYNLTYQIYLQNDRYEDLCIQENRITAPGKYVFTYDNSYTRNTNTIYLRFYTSPKTFFDSEKIERNVSSSRFISLVDNETITSNSSTIIFKSDCSATLTNLHYDFNGFCGLYVPVYYHKIDLSDFEILIPNSEHYFFSCEPQLIIKNYNNFFSDVSGANNSVTFDLELVEDKNKYTFKLKNDLYVNQITLKLSSNPGAGYVKTEHIYFPINNINNQSKFECSFVLKNFGIDRNIVIHNFEYRALKNIFGDCSNSKYCVVNKTL